MVKYQMQGKGRKKMNKARIAIATLTAALAAGGAFAQAAGTGRDAFLKEQAVAEMQRVSAQVDILSSNQEELAERLRKAESAKAEIESLRAEVAASGRQERLGGGCRALLLRRQDADDA